MISGTARHRRQHDIDSPTVAALKTWAAQRRRIITLDQPIPCIIGHLRTQRVAGQRWPEVYTGDAFVVQRIMVNMSEMPRLVIACYYVFTGANFVKAREQAAAIGIEVREYWQELKKAEETISTGLKLLQYPQKSNAHFPHWNSLNETL